MGHLIRLVLNKMGNEVRSQLHIGSPVAANLIVVWGWKYGQHLTPKKERQLQLVHTSSYYIYMYQWKQHNRSFLESRDCESTMFYVEKEERGSSWPGSLAGASSLRAALVLHGSGHVLGFCNFTVPLPTTFRSPLQWAESKAPVEVTEVTVNLLRAKLRCSSLVTPFRTSSSETAALRGQWYKWVQTFSQLPCTRMCFACTRDAPNRAGASRLSWPKTSAGNTLQ